MRISTVDRSKKKDASLVKKPPVGDFSTNMEMAKREQEEKQVKEMLDRIISLGRELKEKPTVSAVQEYKRQIREYLEFVLKHYHKVLMSYSRYATGILIRVEVINDKVEELTSELFKQQRGNIDLAGKIEEIAGLLVDLYR